MSRRSAARDPVAEAEEEAAVAAMNNAVAAEQTAHKERAAKRALSDNIKLRDEIARLLLKIDEMRRRAAEATVRADRDNARANKLSKALAVQAANHADEIERLNATHHLALTDVRAEHRRALVAVNTVHVNKVRDMMREHAERMELVMSGRRPTTTPSAVQPAQPSAPTEMIDSSTLKERKAEVEAMLAFGDPDSYEMRAYNVLAPNLQFTMKALALGFTVHHIAAALEVDGLHVNGYVGQLCRRFNEKSHVGVRALGQELFLRRSDS